MAMSMAIAAMAMAITAMAMAITAIAMAITAMAMAITAMAMAITAMAMAITAIVMASGKAIGMDGDTYLTKLGDKKWIALKRGQIRGLYRGSSLIPIPTYIS